MGVFLFGALFLGSALAQTVTTTPEEELAKKVRAAGEVTSIGSTPFGENISTYDGTLSFRQVDIDQPGLGLPIQLARTYRTDDPFPFSAFADWKLEVPHIETLSANASGTEGDIPSSWFFLNDANRCSNLREAPTIVLSTGASPEPVFYPPTSWWNGYQLLIPGISTQDLLLRDSSNAASPQMQSDGGSLRNFHIVTKQNWMISCLASTSNSKPGEGFLVVSPDGVKYWMDWLVYKKYPKVGFAQPGFGGVARRVAMMMVSRVEDRFGNSLSYSYGANGDLTAIQASDGRRLALAYESGRIRTATLSANDSSPKIWTYAYSPASDSLQRLTEVALPDGRAWSFNLKELRYTWGAAPIIVYKYYDVCRYDIVDTTSLRKGEVVHPSGLIGEFNLKLVMRGRSYVPFLCSNSRLSVANAYTVAAMDKRKISGPGVSAQVWSYKYSPANQSWAKDCGSGCATSVWTEVTDPLGKAVRYTFSNRYDESEGRVLRKDYFVGAAGTSVARSEEYTYTDTAAGPWPTRIGIVQQRDVNKAQLERWAPVVRSTVAQDGGTYVHAVEEFDNFARPLRVTRFNSFGNSRSDVTEYHDDLSLWMLGQTKRTTTNGIETSRTEYAWKASPTKTYAFGKLRQTIGYYTADGTISSVMDGSGNKTSFASWKRGIPQSIQYADGTGQSAVVDDNGWITRVTDENGFQTNYTYDVMGRLASIVYPTGDSTVWNATTLVFEPVAASEYGLPAGHWRQTISTGNARKVTYFDALWRPLVVREYDTANVAATQRFSRFAYDHDGRVTFASYPGTTDALTTGIWTTYDALGRTTSVSQNSELTSTSNPNGLLTTRTEYLPGLKTRVTNPRGQQTTTSYMAYDQPTYDWPTAIVHPEGAFTDISRDVFGKPTAIGRRNANTTTALSRHYVYDAYQRLCKVVEPETRATVLDYDNADNLLGSAAGLNLLSLSSCNTAEAAASGRRVQRSYDARNRVSTLAFPDGNGNQRWTYWPDGQVKQVTTTNAGVATHNSYAYNRRRLPVGESLSPADGEAWALAYGYTPNGHLASTRYPSGQTVTYAPNALGQATQAGTYATGVSYYPNGAIQQFTYGNGIVHTLAQNARQLPDTSQDAYGGTAFLNDGYDYDHNGNVAAISDGASGRNQRGNRTLTYDGLDRLTQAVSPMFGTASYGYDVLDNLTRVVAPGRDHHYCYDGNWRLTNVKVGSCTGSSVIGLGYDDQGNLSNKNGQLFAFDYGNRLREATGKESYRYDGHGRRTHAAHSTGTLRSMYDQGGVLRHQKNARQNTTTDYIQLGGSLVAEAEWPLGQLPSTLDYVNWSTVSGAVRYVVEESVDGVTWASVYEGSDLAWTSLARPSGSYTYRVLACTAAGVCTAVSSVTHAQRPAFNIVPLLYQMILS